MGRPGQRAALALVQARPQYSGRVGRTGTDDLGAPRIPARPAGAIARPPPSGLGRASRERPWGTLPQVCGALLLNSWSRQPAWVIVAHCARQEGRHPGPHLSGGGGGAMVAPAGAPGALAAGWPAASYSPPRRQRAAPAVAQPRAAHGAPPAAPPPTPPGRSPRARPPPHHRRSARTAPRGHDRGPCATARPAPCWPRTH
jgi:hypothetical protein